ncbi:MAG: acetolactate synthase small subunit [SAR324 cluster bacterium]|nr:acetolactate synthase small subunit [SAR324 cluster bacterium]
MMGENHTQIISIEVEDKPGVMTRISALFSRRGFNIKSLSVGNTHENEISRFTIVTKGGDAVIEQIRKQCQKIINVLKVHQLQPEDCVLREFTIIKLKLVGTENTDDTKDDKAIYNTLDLYGGRLLDISQQMLIVEFSGSEEKIDNIYKKLPPAQIIESIRTGKVGMLKGTNKKIK